MTAFFVSIEFAVVKVRASRIDQLVAEKKRGALAAKQLMTNLDEYLSTCQLGVTITSLGLGWIGGSEALHILQPIFERLPLSSGATSTLSFFIAFALITYFHVVIGELAPKTFAIAKAEKVTLLLARPLIVFYKIMYPFIWILNGSARMLTGLFGVKIVSEHEEAHSEEELRLILSDSYESGEINQTEYHYVNKIFEFDNRIAKEIMVPRTEVVGLYLEDSSETHIGVIKNEMYTRYPVFHGNKDNVVGFINVKDFFIHGTGKESMMKDIRDYTRPVLKAIETTPIDELLVEMQKKHMQMAILYDEYGGTAGLVTLEDIIEEIIGEVLDEFDDDEQPPIQEVDENHKIIDGKVLISEVNEICGIEIIENDVDTIGGWIMTQEPNIEEREFLLFGDWEFTVLEKDVHRIKLVEIKRVEDSPEQVEEVSST